MKPRDLDAAAMERRDVAAAAGCTVCPECAGYGETWRDVWVIDGWSVSSDRCPKCLGETWIDAAGKPFKIDQ